MRYREIDWRYNTISNEGCTTYSIGDNMPGILEKNGTCVPQDEPVNSGGVIYIAPPLGASCIQH